MTPTPPTTCPKCESTQGWHDPMYRRDNPALGGTTAAEWLEYECRVCRFPYRTLCADAVSDASPQP